MKTLSLRISRPLWLAGVLASLHLPNFSQAAGLVASWGSNDSGQAQVAREVGRVKAIAAGSIHSMALTLDGRVLTWGSNAYGQRIVPPDLAAVTAIAAGSSHCLALKADGTLVGWGNNSYGQSSTPVGLCHVVAIAAGSYYSLALKADGTVFAWGYGGFGVTNVPVGLSNVVAVAAGAYHSLALKADGTLTAWGSGSSGQTAVPAQLSNVTAVAAGLYHCLALRVDGTVMAWGDNYYGQTNVPAGLANVVAIAAGENHNLALRADGTVVTWGYSSFGQCSVPPGLSNAVAIAAGSLHSLALVFEGPVQILQDPQSQSVAWTSNVTFSVTASGREPLSYQWQRYGMPLVSTGRIAGATSPTLTIADLQFGDTGPYTVVVSNAFGSVVSSQAVLTVIGPPILVTQPASQQVGAGTTVTLRGTAEGTAPLQYQWLLNGTNLAGAASYYLSLANVQPRQSGVYSLLVTNAYGSVQSTGAVLTVTDSPPYFVRQPTNQLVPVGGAARLMVEARGSTPLAYQWRFNGADLPGATNSVLVLDRLGFEQTGYYNAVASNAFGEVVSSKALVSVVQAFVFSDYPYYSTPTNVPLGLTNLVAVAVGDSHVLALKNDGKVVTWAGVSSYANYLTNIPSTVSNVTAVAAGGNCSLVLRANGTVVAWGDAYSRQTNVPAGLSNVMAISVGGTHCLALTSNGTVLAWGSGSSGQTTVPAGLSNVVAVAAGPAHSLALKADGVVVAWGAFSPLTSVPAGLSNVIAISAGSSHNLALKSDGTVRAWGSSSLLTNVPAGLSNVVAVAAGLGRSLALKAEGAVVTWGNQKPNALSGLSNVTAVAASWSKMDQAGFWVTLIGNGAPAWTVQPVSQAARVGGTMQLHGRAVGRQPISYQWQRNGVDLPGASAASLTLPNVQRTNTGVYRLVAVNALGRITSAPATLTLPYSGSLAAALNATNLVWTGGKTNPLWFAQIQESHDGEAAAQSGPILDSQQSVLQTIVTGPGTLSFWWKVSSEEGFDFLKFYLDNALSPLTSISGETGWEQRTFSIPSGTHTLQWVYAKDASVSDGQDAGWVDEVVFAVPAPVITGQPLSQTRNMGGVAAFGIGVSGIGPMTFQWLRSGSELAGATRSSLVLTNLTRRDAGDYAVAVSNPGGTATSSNALLVVRVPQLLGAARLLPDGSFEFVSGDADRGGLLPSDVTALEVQASTNLVDWVPVSNALTLTNGTLLLRDPSTNLSRRFYRIVEHTP